jgi:ELWxxDGT repeat protein
MWRSAKSHACRSGAFVGERLEDRIMLAVTAEMVADLNPTPIGSFPDVLGAWNQELYYSFDGDYFGRELWKFDGQNHERVSLIGGQSGDSDPTQLRVFQNELIFEAAYDQDGDDFDRSIYRYDGNSVEEILYENRRLREVRLLSVYRNELFFVAEPGFQSEFLFRYDGLRVEPLGQLSDVDQERTSNDFVRPQYPVSTVTADGLYFVVHNELWLYQDDNRSLELIASGVGDELGRLGDSLVLEGSGGVLKVDVDFEDGERRHTLTPVFASDSVGDFAEWNGSVYFRADDGEHGEEVYRYDGEQLELIDIAMSLEQPSSYPRALTARDDGLYFTANDGVTGRELWMYDGVSARRLTDLNTSGDSFLLNHQHFAGRLVPVEDGLYFAARDDQSSFELWRYANGEASQVIDHFPLNESSNMLSFQEWNGELFFSADDGVHGRELWRYDGHQISMVADINPGSVSSSPGGFTDWNGRLFFSAAEGDTQRGRKLWSFDGDSVALELELFQDTSGSNTNRGPDYLTPFQGKLYFAWNEDGRRPELWAFDGVDAQRVIDHASGDDAGLPGYLTVVGDRLYFSGWTPQVSRELFYFDGQQVELFADLNTGESIGGPRPSSPLRLVAFDGQLFFRANTTVSTIDFYRVDGDELSTVTTPQGEAIRPGDYAVWRDELYIVDGGLYRFDGTNAIPIPGPLEVWQAVAMKDGLYFVTGYRPSPDSTKLWRWDGQAVTEVQIRDAPPLFLFNDLFVYDDTLYANASDTGHGFELWRLAEDNTLSGDANRDGRVDARDLNVLALNWQRADAESWSQGDFDSNGVVNAADLDLLALNWQMGVPSEAQAAPSNNRIPRAPLHRKQVLVVDTVNDMNIDRHTRRDRVELPSARETEVSLDSYPEPTTEPLPWSRSTDSRRAGGLQAEETATDLAFEELNVTRNIFAESPLATIKTR